MLCRSVGVTAAQVSDELHAAGVQEQEELAPLSGEQQRVADLVAAGRSVFFTGCAGAGLSMSWAQPS